MRSPDLLVECLIECSPAVVVGYLESLEGSTLNAASPEQIVEVIAGWDRVLSLATVAQAEAIRALADPMAEPSHPRRRLDPDMESASACGTAGSARCTRGCSPTASPAWTPSSTTSPGSGRAATSSPPGTGRVLPRRRRRDGLAVGLPAGRGSRSGASCSPAPTTTGPHRWWRWPAH